MAIAKKDNLYNLIKSLTKNEKKYLQDFLKNQKENKTYLQLFNKLDHQSKHQKDDLKTAFDSKAKQLPVIKNYLIQLIQKILNIYHRESSIFDIIQNDFLTIHQLLEKELFDLAEFQINKTIEISRKNNFYHQLLQGLELKKSFLIKKFGATSESIKKETLELIEEQNSLLGKLYNLHEYQTLQATFYEHFYQSDGLNPIIYTHLSKDKLLIEDKEAQTPEAKLIQADLNFRLHVFKDKNFQAADQALQKGLRQLEHTPASIKQNPEQYFALLNQKLQLLLQMKNPTELAQTLYLIRRAPAQYNIDIKKPYLRRYIMEAYALELSLYRQIGEFAKAQDLIKLIESEYQGLNSPSLRQWRAVMDYEIAKFYFDTDQHSRALYKAKSILRAEYSQREAEIQLRSLLLIVQIALKQKNFLLLNQTIKKLKSFYKDIPQSSSLKAGHLENHLLQLLEIYPLCIASPRRHSRLTSRFDKIKASANRKTTVELADLLLWLDQYLQQELNS